jgi:mRNA interferase MazF
VQAKIVLVALPQADGRSKPRPALVLCEMPPFQDVLLAGISSQLQQAVAGFDEIIHSSDAGFATTGLRVTSVVRLGFLSVLPRTSILGTLGTLPSNRHRAIMVRLSDYLLEKV